MPIEAAIIIGGVIAAGGAVVASQLGKPDFPELPTGPTDEEIAGELKQKKKKVVRSQIQAAQRLAALGPIQLEAPTLGI